MSYSYSFLDFNCALVGPGGMVNLGAGSAADGEGITFSPTEEVNKMDIGADGNGMHTLKANKSGKITVRLLKNSPNNALLSAMYAFQTASSSAHGQNIISGAGLVSGDAVTCQQVAFRKAPDIVYATEGKPVEWEFDAITIDRSLGAGV